MREIKFRAKSTHGKRWVYGDLTTNVGGGRYDICYWGEKPRNRFGLMSVSVDTDTIGQFTGLIDKDGRDIYEGDIIECIGSNGHHIRHQILFSNERGCLCQHSVKFEEYLNAYPDCGMIHQKYISDCGKYVIGNIYDNPELLETS